MLVKLERIFTVLESKPVSRTGLGVGIILVAYSALEEYFPALRLPPLSRGWAIGLALFGAFIVVLAWPSTVKQWVQTASKRSPMLTLIIGGAIAGGLFGTLVWLTQSQGKPEPVVTAKEKEELMLRVSKAERGAETAEALKKILVSRERLTIVERLLERKPKDFAQMDWEQFDKKVDISLYPWLKEYDDYMARYLAKLASANIRPETTDPQFHVRKITIGAQSTFEHLEVVRARLRNDSKLPGVD